MIRCTEIFGRPLEYDPAIEMVKEGFSLREVFLNPKYILKLKEDEALHQKAQKKTLVDGLRKDLRFTQIMLNAGSSTQVLTVVGDMSEIARKLAGKTVKTAALK